MNHSRFFLSLFVMFLSPLDLLWSQDAIQDRVRLDNLASIVRYRSRASGNWNTPSTWEISTDNGQTWRGATSTTPASGSAACTIVLLGHTVTVTQSVAIDSTLIDGQVTINPGQTLTIANAPGTDLMIDGTILNQGTFSVNAGATWMLNAGATFIQNSSSGISSALNAATISSSSTFEYRDSGTPSLSGRTYGNLKLTTAGSKTYTNSASSGSLTVCGLLEIGMGVTWITGGLETDISVQGSTIVNGIWTGSGNANQGTHTFKGAFSVSSSGAYSLATTGAIQGNLNFNSDLMVSGSLTAPSNRSVSFSGGSPQTIGGGSTISLGNGLTASQNLTVGAGATVQIAVGKVMKVLGDLTVLGSINGPGSLSFEGDSKTLMNNGSITASAAFVPAAARIAGTGVWSSITIASGCDATIEGEHALIGAGTPLVVNGTAALKSSSTIVYRGSSSQTIAPLAYRNMEINNLAGATLSSTASISGVLTLRKGVFSAGSNLTLASSASIVRETGSLTGTPNFGFQVNVIYGGSVAVTTGPEIPSDTSALVSLTINNPSGVTLGRGAIVNGTVDVTGGNLITGPNTLTLGASATINEAGPYALIGQIRTTRPLTAGMRETFGSLGVEINAAGVAPGITAVSRVTGSASTLAGGTSIMRYFDITPTVNSALSATLVFRYGASDLNGIKAENLKLFKSTDSGLSWATVGGVVDVPNKNVTIGLVSSFSRWTAGEPFPVPTLANVSPTIGEIGSSLTIELRGTGFVPGVSTVAFSGGGISVNSCVVNSSTCIVANIAISSLATPGYRNVSVANAGAGTVMLPDGFEVRKHLNPVPSVVCVEPSIGVRGKSLSVKLRGRGFVAGLTTVSFGDSIEVRSLVIAADTSLAATIFVAPGTALGVRSILAVNPAPGGGTSTLLGAFTVANPAPTLSSLSLTAGARGLSFWMTLTGTNFVRDSSRASFGNGLSVDSTVVLSSSILSIKLKIGLDAIPGARDVTVTNTSPGGGVATLPAAFLVTNPTPTLSTVIPDSGWLGQSSNVVLTGTNYIEKVTAVSFGDGIAVDSISVQSGDRIHARLSIAVAATAGLRDVSVVNGPPGGGTATLKGGFRILNLQPTISSVTPSQALSGESLTLTILGANFIQAHTQLYFGPGITVNSVTIENPSQLRVAIAISPMTPGGPRDVEVTIPAPGGGSARLSGGFTVNNPSPTLTSLSATSGARGKAVGLLVTGSGFLPGATAMSFGPGVALTSLSVSNPSQLFVDLFIARDAALGFRDVTVTNASPGGGTQARSAAFEVVNPPPTLTSVLPASGNPGQSLSATLAGSDFFDGVSTVSLGDGITVNTATVNSAGSQMTAAITIGTTATPGARNVTVTNPAPGGGIASLTGGFDITLPAPRLTGATPASGATGQMMTLILTGSGFVAGMTSVSFGTSVIVDSITVTSPTQMSISITIGFDATLGSRDIVVTNPAPGGGSVALPGSFTVVNPSPTLTAVMPVGASRGDVVDVVLTGTSFITGVTTVSFGDGIAVNLVTVSSATQATANIAVGVGAVAGVHAVSVTNPAPGGGTSTLESAFTVGNPAPTLTSINQSGGARGQTLNVALVGTGFSAAVSSVNFGAGIAVSSLRIGNATQIEASIIIAQDAALGMRDVSVTNAIPGGGTATLSDVFTVLNPAPTISSISPDNGVLGQSIQATVRGAGFLMGVTSLSMGDGLMIDSVTVDSISRLQARLSIAGTTQAGPRGVSVTNTPPGGGTSTLVDGFMVLNPQPTILNVTPSVGVCGQQLSVTVVGTNFIAGRTALNFGNGIIVHSLDFGDPTKLDASISVEPFAISGMRDVVVRNPGPGGGSAMLKGAFAVNNPVPAVVNISITSGYRGKTYNLLVNGTNFVSGATTLNLGRGIEVHSITISNPSQLFAYVSIERNAVPGSRDIIVTNSEPGGGTSVIPGGFTVQNPPPILRGVTPGTGILCQSLVLGMSGSDFFEGVTSLSLGSGISLKSMAIDSTGTQITATIAIDVGAATGPRDVVVVNSGPGGGIATLTDAFDVTIPKPMLTRLSPLGGVRGQTLDVSIAGSGFVANSTHMSFGPGVSVNSQSALNPTEMVANISIGNDAALGPRDVVITNSPPGGGTMTLSNAFTVANPAPLLLSVSPMSGNKGQTLDVVLIGACFLPEVTSVVFGDGVIVNSITVNGLSQATANLSIASDATPGSRNATITNAPPGGGNATLVAAFIIANPPPKFSSISPIAGYRGQSMAVTIVGQDFVDGMTTVDFGPNILVSSNKVITATRLSANIIIETCAAVGARTVTVNNAAPGGGSALLTNAFTICNPAPTLTGLNPGVGTRGHSLSVNVTGTNIIAGTTTINFGTNVTLNSFEVSSLAEANANITIPVLSVPGMRDVSINNPPPGGGTATLSGAFSIINPVPTIAKVTPGTAAPGSHLNMEVIGSQFISGVTNLSLGSDLAVSNLFVNNSTTLHADISIGTSAASGPRTVVVTNAAPGGGSANLTDGFIVDSETLTSVEGALGTVPDHFMLSEAYPNPFNGSARIRYGLPEDSRVTLYVYAVLGNMVAQLVNGQRSKGSYELQWCAGNLPSGVYIVRMNAESRESTRRYTSSRKVILMK